MLQESNYFFDLFLPNWESLLLRSKSTGMLMSRKYKYLGRKGCWLKGSDLKGAMKCVMCC